MNIRPFPFTLAAILFLSPFSSILAQSFPVWDDYDSTFYIGSDVPGNVDTAMDGLTIDYAWNYVKLISDWKRAYHAPINYHDSAHHDFVSRAYARGFRIIVGPEEIWRLCQGSAAVENYPGGISWAHDTNGIHLPPLKDDSINVSRIELNDRGLFYYLLALRDTATGARRMAWEPRATIQTFDVDSRHDSVYSWLGLPNQSNTFRVSFGLFTDTADFINLGVGDSDTIAFAILLRRYTNATIDTCNCHIAERFDTIAITAGMYKSASVINPEGFREVGRYYGMDTIATSLRVTPPLDPDRFRWAGYQDTGSACDLHCDSLYATLDSVRYVYPYVAEASDLMYEFWTTGIVPIRLLRGKTNTRLYDLLVAGEADEFIDDMVDSIIADPVMDSVTWRISITNELKPWWEARPYGIIASKLLSVFAAKNRPWQLHVNPYYELDAIRALTGDLDSTSVRIVQSMVPQPYSNYLLVTELYADTARMDSIAVEQYFRGLIRYNTMVDYQEFTVEMTDSMAFLDYFRPTYFSGGWVRAVDVARFKYRHFVPSYPVYPSVQAQGHFPLPEGTTADVGFRFAQPPPEYGKRQIWYALNCGGDGVHLADVNWTGENGGYMYERTGDHSAEYGSLPSPNPDVNFNSHVTWLGLSSRYDTVRNTVRAVRRLDTLVGWRNLIYNQEQLSAYDTRQSFNDLPFLDTVLAKRARRYELDSNGAFIDSTIYDARDSTYFEITYFSSGPGDTSDWGEETHYFLVTNLRLWPLDTVVNDVVNSLPRIRSPLGFIDARKPVIRFANTSSEIADSVVIEGLLSGFNDTASFDELIELCWLKPGSAELFRVTMLPALLSDLGTAYNNGIRSENPSSDTVARDRLVVYERDSVVYLRTVDDAGAWSAEVMLSSTGDTAVVNGKRLGSNFFPSLAFCRNNLGVARVVWERRDTLGRHSVESILLLENPITRQNVAGVVDSQSYRQSLLPPTYPEGPSHLTPVIVGIHDTTGTGGFIVAWSGPDSGITVLAIRELTDGISFLASQDSVSIRRVHANLPLDSICLYPTLAHVPRFELMNGTSGRLAGTDAEKIADVLTDESLYWYNRVHLAYQQGDGDESVDEQIFYHPIGVIFPDEPSDPPGLFVGNYEPVTRKIDGCSFVHPSIAADSARVGVAFEILELGGGQRNVGLRFRDTAGSNQGTPLKAWETILYRWGGPLTQAQRFFGLGSSFQRPSLTGFPLIDSTSLALNPEGGLTWFQGDNPVGRECRQWLYRYGWFSYREIGDGKHPTMMLVPSDDANPFEVTGVFHRGTDSTRTPGLNEEGDPVYRYAARLLNTPGHPISYFSAITSGAGIQAGATLTGVPVACNRHRKMDFGFIFSHGNITHPDDDRHIPGDPPDPPMTPDLPPTFFKSPGKGTTLLDTLASVSNVVRTSLFTIGNEPVPVRRYAGGGDSLSEWLDGYGMDSVRGVPANVWIVMELVRAADSVVLWRSDSIDARDLDTLEEPYDDVLGVPADDYADSGTVAFIQMRGFASAGVVYDLHGGFEFFTVDSTTSGFIKLVHPGVESKAAATTGESALNVRVIPNPARDRAEIRIRVLNAGRVRLAVYNALGVRLADLPDLEADTPGEYSVEISLANVLPGTYLLHATSGAVEVMERFSVIR